MSSIIFPRPLRKGDRIAIISPASAVKPEYVDGAARAIAARGFVPVVMPHAKGPADGSFAAGERSRIADFTAAWNDTGTKAVLCARGGYGCVGILPAVPGSMLRANAKWLVGFSDVSSTARWQSISPKSPPTTPRRKPCSACSHRKTTPSTHCRPARSASAEKRKGGSRAATSPCSTALPRQGSTC